MTIDCGEAITIAIANIPVSIYLGEETQRKQLSERYDKFFSDEQAVFHVYIKTQPVQVSSNFIAEVKFHYDSDGNKIRFDLPGFSGYIDLLQGQAELINSKYSLVETTDYMLRILLALLVFKKGGILFHGAGIIRNRKTYLFFGHSGSGKSTVARLSPQDIVINDDLVVLMPVDNKWIVFATPFWNPSQVRPVPDSAPLTGLYRLVQDKQVYLEGIAGGQALAELIANIPVIPDNPFMNSELFVRGRQLLEEIPIYRLHFLPDDSFWQVVEEASTKVG